MSDEWAARARSFGAVAEQYDRYRPGYPDQLYTDLLGSTAGQRVLEAGAGTGRATLELVRRGAATVVAIEPDPAMADIARARTSGWPVDVRGTRFEDHRPEPGAFDLVVSAQAWHWVDVEAASAVATHALDDDGVLALWWNQTQDLDDDPLWQAIHAAYARHAPEIGPLQATRPEHEATTDPAVGFGPWTRTTYEWTAVYDAESYTRLVTTHSNHLLLPAAQRERLVDGVREAILDAGDRVEYHYRTLLLRAPKQH